MTTQITEGRFTAHLHNQDGSVLVILTRDGQCLPGIPSKFYADAKRAQTGAARMIAKARG